MIVFAAIAPHPPLSVPGVGKTEYFAQLKATLRAYDILREGLERAKPDVIVMISPHGYMEPYAFVINSATDLTGDFSEFSSATALSFKNDISIADNIMGNAGLNEIPVKLRQSFLDHGTLVPLYHLTKNIHPKLVHLSFSLMDYESHYCYGEIIKQVIGNYESRRVAIIASGDLSHKLSASSLCGYSPGAAEFDRAVVRFLAAGNISGIMDMGEGVTQDAAECGMRSIVILLGILSGRKYDFNMLSYECPFGIGYLTARLV